MSGVDVRVLKVETRKSAQGAHLIREVGNREKVVRLWVPPWGEARAFFG